MLESLKELATNLDTTLGSVVSDLGIWAYIVLFAIVFLETGVIVFAFLPGDTLLLAVGVVAANPDVNFSLLIIDAVLIIAAILGNMANYMIGRKYGRSIINSGRFPFVKPKNIQRAEAFYNHYGAYAIIASRFFPYVRSFVPFFAGVAEMDWKKYMLYNTVGALLWILSLTIIGYFFGNLPIVKDNIAYVILFLAVFPFIPMLYARMKTKKGN